MRYDDKINKKLRTAGPNNDDECLYKLTYDGEKGSYFIHKDTLRYANKHYLKKDNIIEENLLNDLNIFKTYRNDVEQAYNNRDHFNKILSLLLTCVTTIFGAIGNKGNYEYKLLFGLMIAIAYTNMIYSVFRTTSKSESAKIKFTTNAIYTLETIKEDMDKRGNSSAKSGEIINGMNDKQDDGNTENIVSEDADEIISGVNDKLDDANTENITTEDANERYEGLELTEAEEIRIYTYKATKNEYSPRAMYEKKGR